MADEMRDAILNGLYDKKYAASDLFGPAILDNRDEKIWQILRRELYSCKKFIWAVAFITQDMLVPFKAVMADLKDKGVGGILITGDYLGFNNPRVFEELNKIPNLTVKIATEAGFHVKGYVFEHSGFETIIIGSANFTRSALLSNYEWAMKITSQQQAELTKQLTEKIRFLSQNSFEINEKWLADYQKNWQPTVNNYLKISKHKVLPNQMQKAALKNLAKLINNGAHRGLVVSATGTGKTYLGAFAVKSFKPRKFLYVVHREQIAKKSLESFYRVIGGQRADYGLLSGSHHDLNKKYLFATIQTLSQPEMLSKLKENEFDYILIDEAHRSAASSYQKVMQHFKPRFWLGLTATPERMDEQNVYQIFDYNLAYDIRLRDALEEKMLTPFHYVGVQDYEADGEVVNDTTNLRCLISSERVNYILKEMDYYGYCGEKAKGLVFCSRQDEARELAKLFSKKSHPAVALTNQDNERRRNEVVSKLVTGEIEYIIAVDLFNEGIDIPSLNQIVMLRSTQSSIVFIQQLGRGLRKYPGKEFVTVLDFIGNYKNNYMIPIALNQDTSCDKDQAKREVRLPQFIDVSTINFSKVAAERILTSIENTKLDSMKELRQSYRDLKNKLGRIPLLFDFYQYGSVSPSVFAQNHVLDNYAIFLRKMGEKIEVTEYENKILTFLTKELLNGKRIHELLLLKMLLENNVVEQGTFIEKLKQHDAYVDNAVIESINCILSLDFFDVKQGKTTKKEQYGDRPLINRLNLFVYKLNADLHDALKHDVEFKKLFVDAIKTGLALNKKYNNQAKFTLYKQYDRKDACRLLNWPKDVSAPMYGYRVGKHDTPIFITYQKDDNEKRNAIYRNTLLDGRLRWYTRMPRHLDSDEVQRLLQTKDMRLHLFVKRSDADGKQFLYLGDAIIQRDSVKEELLGPKKRPAVGMDLLLQQPLTPKIKELLFE